MELREILKPGNQNATSFENLSRYFGLEKRDMLNLIERERRAGVPILSKKNDGGGYFLPETEEEKKAYLNNKLSEVATVLETLKAINTGKKTPLKSEIIPQLEAIIKAN